MKAAFLKKFHDLTDADVVDLCFQMAEAHPETFEQLLAGGVRSFTFPSGNWPGDPPITVTFSDDQMRKIRSLSHKDTKVTLIKEIRTWTGLGLKEAKDLVEQEFIPLEKR